MAQSYYATIKSGGSSPSGIGYRRILPMQYNSYRTGDTGYHYQLGTFDYSADSSCVNYIQDLDYSLGAASFYFLANDNAFGNRNRFTNSIGGAASDNRAKWTAADFTGALNGYVIDHLTGVAYDVSFDIFGNWNTCIDSIVASSKHGYSDWYPISNQHVFSVINPRYLYYNNTSGQSNIYSYLNVLGTPQTLIWMGGDTREYSSSSAYRYRATNHMGEILGKTAATMYMFMARNHY